MMKVHGTANHPLTKWRLRQEPPWPVTFLAKRLGTNLPWISKITSSVSRHRATPELAYAVEILTKGEVSMLDMLLTKEQQREIERRLNNGS